MVIKANDDAHQPTWYCMGELTDKGEVGCEAGVAVSGNVYDDETAEMVDTDGEP